MGDGSGIVHQDLNLPQVDEMTMPRISRVSAEHISGEETSRRCWVIRYKFRQSLLHTCGALPQPSCLGCAV